MSFTFINIKDVFRKHYEILAKGGAGNFVIFIVFPLLLSILSIFINGVNDSLDNILSTLLSIFVGLFINLLVIIISATRGFSKNKNKTRIKVIEEMFYNITFVITLSLFALVLILCRNIYPFPESFTIEIESSLISFNTIYLETISFVFVFLFVEILLTIILIIKRIFRLFNFDIKEIKNNINIENSKN